MRIYLHLVGLLVVMLAGTAQAANCSLRNPDRQIYEIFENATSYRTVVASVDDDSVLAIKKKYHLDLAFTDRGKHTLYIVMTDGIPIGFVHARVETGVRGSVELIWAIDLDLRIHDFRVQRSREKHTDVIKSAEFRAQLVGLDARELNDLARPNGTADLARLNLPAEAQAIADCVIACGRKTFAVTQAAFATPLSQARLLGNVHRVFPATVKVKRIVQPLNSPPNEESTEAIASPTVLRALDENQATLGMLVYQAGDYEFWCWIDIDQTITKALALDTADLEFTQSMAALGGTDFETARTLEPGEVQDNALMALALAAQHNPNPAERVVTGK